MIIRIINNTTFQIVEQRRRNMMRKETHTPIGSIEVMCSAFPDISYMFFNSSSQLKVFVRGDMLSNDNRLLVVKSPSHLPHVLKAIEKFCTFNDESFEIEPCIL